MPKRKPAWSLLLLALATALFFLGYPNYVIRPKRHQGAHELQYALFVLRYQHLVEIFCAAAAFIALVWLLRLNKTPGARIRIIAAAAVVFLSAGLSFVNVYEVMFHPAGAPAFLSARDTKLDGDEKVLAINAHAYPVRSLAYHHIVNDTEDGIPIAVTY